MRSFTISGFKRGLNTSKQPDKLDEGEASDSKNWLAKDESLELSGGSTMVGDTAFTGSVTGLYSTAKSDGTLVVWQKVGAKLYVKDGSADWAEVGSSLFGTDASDDVASFAEWKGLTGSWVFVSSTNSGLWKLSVAQPTSYVAYPDAGYNGDIAVIQDRLWVWNWLTTGGTADTTGFQLSHQPGSAASDYTQVTGESVATGDGSDLTFSGTLAFKAAAATRNCFGVVVEVPILDVSSVAISGISKATSAVVSTTNSIAGIIATGTRVAFSGMTGMTQINNLAGTATYVSDHSFSVNIDSSAFGVWSAGSGLWKLNSPMTDDGMGVLTTSDGSAGTVNYSSGAVTLTFITAPPNGSPIPTTYYWEDSYADGLAKFSPLSSAAGDGLSHYLPQPGIGAAKNVSMYGGSAFCVHGQGVNQVTFDQYLDPASNTVFRATSGPSSKLAAAATADGIYYVDDASGSDVHLRVIRTINSAGSVYVDNPSVSKNVILKDYGFSSASVAVKGDLVAVACAADSGTVNDTVFVFDRRLGNVMRLSYPAKHLATYGAELVYGDVAQGSVWTLLDGTLFSGEPTDNYWISGDHDAGYDGIKRARHLWVEGRMAQSQELVFEANCDNTGWSEIGRISGTDSQVDDTASGAVGDDEIGATEVGLYDSEPSFHFNVAFSWNIKYRKARLKVEAVGVGPAFIDCLQHHDVRLCGSRLPQKYRS